MKFFSPLGVRQNTITHSGSGDFPLAPAIVEGFRRFGDAVNDNDQFMYYAKAAEGVDEWEIGIGTFDATGDGIIDRSVQVQAGSNGTNKVFFTSGIITVSLVAPHFFQNFVATAQLLNSTPPAFVDLPEVNGESTVAIGKRANANSGSRAIAIGEDSRSGTDSVILGTGCQTSASETVMIGHSCNGKSSGSMSPFYTVGLGIKATPYARSMFSNSAGGSVSSDITRMYIQTTNTTPDLLETDQTGGPAGDFFDVIADGRAKSVTFEVHLLARNATDNDAWYEKFNLVGVDNGAGFVQIGSTTAQEIVKGAGLTGAVATCTIVGNDLQINVTGLLGKTIDWAATVITNTFWHAGVPGSGV